MVSTKRVAVALAAVVLSWLVLRYLPYELVGSTPHLTEQQRLQVITDERRTVVALLAGVWAAAGLLLTYMRHQLELDSNRTDRYAKAVELLAHEEVAVRMGGLYALSRIAEDSERDRKTILDLLSAYIRDKAPKRDMTDTSREIYPEPPTDVLAAMSALGRRPAKDKSYPPVDLNGVALKGRRPIDLVGANLTDANFRSANISHANMTNAILRGADFTDCILEEVKLDGAVFAAATLIAPNFIQASAKGADFRGAHIDHMFIIRGQLQGADFRNTTVVDCRFDDANLDGVDFTGANLANTTMGGAKITSTTKLSQAQIDTLMVEPDGTTRPYDPSLEVPRPKWAK